MNGRVAKRIRREAKLTNKPVKQLKKEYYATPQA